jgi:polar amino acid transport system permease protein
MGGALMFQTYGLVQAEYLVEAMRWTASLAAMAMLGGAIGGALMVALRLSNALIPRTVGRAVTYVAQGTPLLVQLFLAYFGASAIGLDVPPLAAAAFAFTLWASAFLGDIWCGAIETGPKGQREAGLALGLRPRQLFWRVVLPQAVRPAIPPTVGFLVQVVKNTAIASIIGFRELTRAGQIVANVTFQPMPVFLTVAVLYFALCYPLSLAARLLERRLGSARIGPIIV